MAVASTSLQSLQSFASVQSSSSLAALAAERAASPNLIFQGGYEEEAGDSEEDSYIARLHQ
jgi:hypothetical protein